jgi:hypothetical protein
MRRRALVLIPALVVATLALGAAAAPAATLFTTAAHTTRVAVGMQLTMTTTAPFDLTAPPGTLAARCTDIALQLTVTENNDTRVSFDETGGSLGGCTVATTLTVPWKFTVSGSGVVVGANTAFRTTVDTMAFDFAGVGSYLGNLTTGVTATQPTTGTAPICVAFANAGGWSIATTASAVLETRFCMIGTSAALSLAN